MLPWRAYSFNAGTVASSLRKDSRLPSSATCSAACSANAPYIRLCTASPATAYALASQRQDVGQHVGRQLSANVPLPGLVVPPLLLVVGNRLHNGCLS
jgi:hypothetical protein